MKIMSTTALAAALALAAAGAGIVATPAFAKDKKAEAAKAPDYKLSKPVREALLAEQTALQAGDTATALAKVQEAKAAATTDDDKYFVGQSLYTISQTTKDPKQQQEGFELMLTGNRLEPVQRGQILVSLGQAAMQAGNYPLAEQRLSEAQKLDPNNTDSYALLAETRVKAGRPAEAVAMFQQAMANAKTTGTKLPPEWYGRAVNISYTAKLPQQTEAITQEWLTTYPTRDNWRDSLVIWRDLNKVDSDTQIDLMRLQRSANALKGAGDYMEYVDSVYLKNPGEAKAVLDEGVKAGFVNLASNANAKDINGVVTGRIAADKASLSKSAADAKGAKGTGKLTLNVADAYLGYGMWTEAADMYRIALTKPGTDANLINTRLGMALAKSGDKAGAQAAFAKVTGQRAGLVKYWTILLAQGAPA